MLSWVSHFGHKIPHYVNIYYIWTPLNAATDSFDAHWNNAVAFFDLGSSHVIDVNHLNGMVFRRFGGNIDLIYNYLL